MPERRVRTTVEQRGDETYVMPEAPADVDEYYVLEYRDREAVIYVPPEAELRRLERKLEELEKRVSELEKKVKM